MALTVPPTRRATVAQLRTWWPALAAPERSTANPPAFLRPEQRDGWQRVHAALDSWGAALLADPVGTGKTWIALAMVAHHNARTVVIGPAALRHQWQLAAKRANTEVAYHSHERLSRGVLPTVTPEFVVIDEAHRFRHPATRRYRTVAPWLPGRRVLLLTATPVVNRRADLLSLLRLVFATDALALDGFPDLTALLECDTPPPALARLVIRTSGGAATVPTRRQVLAPPRAESRRIRAALDVLRRLKLGAHPATRRLIATVLLDAAGSSDAAWRVALRRYRALLLQSRDAGGISRMALRQLAGPALDQTVMWSLFDTAPAVDEPPLSDLPVVERALDTREDDAPWLESLATITGDRLPTICFCRHRATARRLVTRLGDDTAWITGTAAGIGPHRLPREQLLAAFGPDRSNWQARRRIPTVLVTTEVLAEGIDLQGASRVIHVDLPWHAARMEQRNGRLLRIGQLAPEVIAVHRQPPPLLERRLRLMAGLRRKGQLADRWLATLTAAPTSCGIAPGFTWCARANGLGYEAVAVVSLAAGTRTGVQGFALQDGSWHQTATLPPLPHALAPLDAHDRSSLGRCRRTTRRLLWRALAGARSIHAPDRALVERLLLEARTLRIERRHRELDAIDRVLAVAAAPGPVGLQWTLATLAMATRAELVAAALPAARPAEPPTVAWVVLILRSPEADPLRCRHAATRHDPL